MEGGQRESVPGTGCQDPEADGNVRPLRDGPFVSVPVYMINRKQAGGPKEDFTKGLKETSFKWRLQAEQPKSDHARVECSCMVVFLLLNIQFILIIE